MKRDYCTPCITFEPYTLTSQIAGACRDADLLPVSEQSPINLNGKTVHCVIAGTTDNKNCSKGAHTWTITMSGTIFADGAKEGGCTYDVYNQSQYVDLLEASYLESGSTVSGGSKCNDGNYFCFKGNSHQHTASIAGIDYANYFKS